MIEIIQGSLIESRSDLIDEMFKLRARVFKDILDWDVHVEFGREFDRFDDEDPLYLLSLNSETGKLQGSVRLLPTTGPNMLRHVFGDLLDDGEIVESQLIWESSRFVIDPDLGRDNRAVLNSVTIELLCGLVETGLEAGITHIVSVYDARMTRIFRLANCSPDVIGGPKKIGKVSTYAGLFEVSLDRWTAIAASAGFNHPVLKQFGMVREERALSGT